MIFTFMSLDMILTTSTCIFRSCVNVPRTSVVRQPFITDMADAMIVAKLWVHYLGSYNPCLCHPEWDWILLCPDLTRCQHGPYDHKAASLLEAITTTTMLLLIKFILNPLREDSSIL
jgi:hypothetical protein